MTVGIRLALPGPESDPSRLLTPVSHHLQYFTVEEGETWGKVGLLH